MPHKNYFLFSLGLALAALLAAPAAYGDHFAKEGESCDYKDSESN